MFLKQLPLIVFMGIMCRAGAPDDRAEQREKRFTQISSRLEELKRSGHDGPQLLALLRLEFARIDQMHAKLLGRN